LCDQSDSTSVSALLLNLVCDDIAEPEPWWHTTGGITTIGMSGGALVMIIFAVCVYSYYRRRRAALQAHLTTMYESSLLMATTVCES
jgi:hypothetical protein